MKSALVPISHWIASSFIFVSVVHSDQNEPCYRNLGCFTDSVSSRTLNGPWTSSDSMTYAECANICNGYDYFGLEYSSQCYCGLTIESPGSQTSENSCNMPCTGDSAEVCGGAGLINVIAYDHPAWLPSDPIYIDGYIYLGCYTDSVSARVLDEDQHFDSAMTVGECAQFCEGYTYFAVEFGTQCYCGNTLANPTSKISIDQCSYICGGDNAERCGGAATMNLYKCL